MTSHSVMFGFLSLFCVCIYYRFMCVYVSIIDFWFVLALSLYIEIYIYIHDYFQLFISYVQTHFPILHFYSPSPCLLFLTSYFTSFVCVCVCVCVYSLAICHGYRWFYYLSVNIPLPLCIADLLHLLSIWLYQWDFFIHNFIFLFVIFSFLVRKVSLTFLVKLVCWCCSLLVFACL